VNSSRLGSELKIKKQTLALAEVGQLKSNKNDILKLNKCVSVKLLDHKLFLKLNGNPDTIWNTTRAEIPNPKHINGTKDMDEYNSGIKTNYDPYFDRIPKLGTDRAAMIAQYRQLSQKLADDELFKKSSRDVWVKSFDDLANLNTIQYFCRMRLVLTVTLLDEGQPREIRILDGSYPLSEK
jgi:hypothetical protein